MHTPNWLRTIVATFSFARWKRLVQFYTDPPWFFRWNHHGQILEENRNTGYNTMGLNELVLTWKVNSWTFLRALQNIGKIRDVCNRCITNTSNEFSALCYFFGAIFVETVLKRVEEMSDHIQLHTCPSIWLQMQFDIYVVAYFLSQVIFVSCFCFRVW